MTKEKLAHAIALNEELDITCVMLENMRTARRDDLPVTVSITIADKPGYNPDVVKYALSTDLHERLIVALEGMVEDLKRMFEAI